MTMSPNRKDSIRILHKILTRKNKVRIVGK